MKKIISAFAATLFCCGLAGTATAAETYRYEGAPVAIEEYVWNYVDITNSIDALGKITDVDVFVDITFTSIADLRIYVAHDWVDGGGVFHSQWVQLYQHDETTSFLDDLPSITFDDDALVSITDATRPGNDQAYTEYSTYRPTENPDQFADSNLLSYFEGAPATGDWYLAIWDYYAPDGENGSVNAFNVIITTDAETNPVPLPGALVCLGSGLSALAAVRRVRRK